jgi:hypothetical protein
VSIKLDKEVETSCKFFKATNSKVRQSNLLKNSNLLTDKDLNRMYDKMSKQDMIDEQLNEYEIEHER